MKKIFYIILLVLSCSFNLYASDVSLEWDANTDASYYIVYWGNESGAYTENSGYIKTNTYTITGVDNVKKYASVKAFNSYGNSSDFADEISFEVNVIPVDKPTNFRVLTIDLAEVKNDSSS